MMVGNTMGHEFSHGNFVVHLALKPRVEPGEEFFVFCLGALAARAFESAQP